MTAQIEVSLETRFPIADNSTDFPFKCELSLAPLIAIWKSAARGGRPIAAMLHQKVLEEAGKAPELLCPCGEAV
jgi:hypothetical protein